MVIKGSRDSFFEEAPEDLEEFFVFLRVLFRLGGQMLDEALRQKTVEFLNQGTVLHRFTGNIQRKIFAIHYTTKETQPLGQKALGLGIDKNLAAIERDSGLHLPETKSLGIFSRRVEQCVDINRRVGTKVKRVTRLINSMRAVLVKLFILFVADFPLILQPNCFDSIDELSVEIKRK